MDDYRHYADELYDAVFNYEWTHDKMKEFISNKYMENNLWEDISIHSKNQPHGTKNYGERHFRSGTA